jgi:plastocyanin
MNKKVMLSVVAVVVIAAAVVGVVIAKGNKSDDTSKDTAANSGNMDMDSPSNGKPDNSDTNTAAADTVTIQDFAFSPANITVKPGTTVTWTNKDSAAHTVTATDGKKGLDNKLVLDSGTINSGQKYAATFSTPGVYHYRCNFHSSMTGTVTVEP